MENAVERLILLDKVGITGPGPFRDSVPLSKSIQASVTNGGAAVVNIEVSNDSNNFVLLGTITLSSGTPSDGFLSDAPWVAIRANVVSVSAGCTVTCMLGGI